MGEEASTGEGPGASRAPSRGAPGMAQEPGVEVPPEPYRRESDVKGSCTKRVTGIGQRQFPAAEPARACGMEACSEAQHRTRVNPCAGCWSWVSVPRIATPNIWSRSNGTGGGGAKFLCLTLGDLPESGDGRRGRKAGPMLGEKSDRLIVAMKPGNAGGAKGATT